MGSVQLTPAAEDDLETIWDHTCDQWDARQADRYVDLLLAECALLAEAPLTAAPCDHIRTGYRRRGAGKHVIYFRIVDEGIVIVRILHERMDQPSHL